MHVFARAMRGPSWLAWLSLLFATQIAAADPVVGFDADDGHDRGAVHASARPRPAAAVLLSSNAALDASPRDLTATPALPIDAAGPPQTAGVRAPGVPVRTLASSTTLARLHPRAPPCFRIPVAFASSV